MQMVFLRLDFVVVLLPIEVHEIKFIDQAHPLQQFKRSVDGRAIEIRLTLPSQGQQAGCVKVLIACWIVSIRARRCEVNRIPLDSAWLNSSQRLSMPISSCDSVAPLQYTTDLVRLQAPSKAGSKEAVGKRN